MIPCAIHPFTTSASALQGHCADSMKGLCQEDHTLETGSQAADVDHMANFYRDALSASRRTQLFSKPAQFSMCLTLRILRIRHSYLPDILRLHQRSSATHAAKI